MKISSYVLHKIFIISGGFLKSDLFLMNLYIATKHWFIFTALGIPILRCLDYHSSIVSLKVRWCGSSRFIIFQISLGYSVSFACLYIFKNELAPCFVIVLNLYFNLGKIVSYVNIKS